MKKILEFLSGNVIGEIGKVIDNLFTTVDQLNYNFINLH